MKKYRRSKSLIVPLLFVSVIIVSAITTVGFALYSELLTSSIGVTIKPDGRFLITNMAMVESSNVISSEVPVINDDQIDFNVEFGGQEEEYFATYTFDAQNNSSYNYTFNTLDFTPSVSSDMEEATGELSLEVLGIEEGESIRPGETRAITLILRLVPTIAEAVYETAATYVMDNAVQDAGTIALSINATDADLSTSGGKTGTVKLGVINTYSDAVTFNVSSLSNLFVVSAGGSNLTIDGNSESEFTLTVVPAAGIQVYDNTASTSFIVSTSGKGSYISDQVTFTIDKTLRPDVTKPSIGNITLKHVSKDGVAQAEFYSVSETSQDYVVSGIDTYGVLLYSGIDDSLIGEYPLGSNNSTGLIGGIFDALGGKNTSAEMTGLSEGPYYVKIYGVDKAGNSGLEDCPTATTETPYCKKSETLDMKWIYNVNFTLSYATVENNPDTAIVGTDYSQTVTPDEGYKLPSSATVTMGGKTVSKSTLSGYSISGSEITVKNVSGDIDITITATVDSGSCLVEGTKVRLAGGKYKDIKDIGYDDLLEVYNYDTGKMTYEYPIWIEKEKSANKYTLFEFSDGSNLKIYGKHAVYSSDYNEFVDISDKSKVKIGSNIVKVDKNGKRYIVSVKKVSTINDNINYYHVVSTRYYNIIANDFITTDDNVILSNLYGFNKDIIWNYPKENDLYSYKDLNIMPYYMYKGLRAGEAKVLNNFGLDLNTFKGYLSMNQLNPSMIKNPITDRYGNRLWMVTTSDDIVNSFNKQVYLLKEGSSYILKNPSKKSGFKYWYNTSDNKFYKPGDTITIWHGTHFVAIYE